MVAMVVIIIYFILFIVTSAVLPLLGIAVAVVFIQVNNDFGFILVNEDSAMNLIIILILIAIKHDNDDMIMKVMR